MSQSLVEVDLRLKLAWLYVLGLKTSAVPQCGPPYVCVPVGDFTGETRTIIMPREPLHLYNGLSNGGPGTRSASDQ
jgi:hypothetical protein